MKISIEIIPHELQRYPTVGDWIFEDEAGDTILKINVSSMSNKDYEFLVGLHEMVEAFLCRRSGISTEMVDKWDKDHLDSDNPGSLTDCPYRKQHLIATVVEMTVAYRLGVQWSHYERTLNNL